MARLKKMVIEEDYKDMIVALTEANVKFLVVGGYAVGLHGYPRDTKDIDFWVWANPGNAVAVMQALEKFKAPMINITEKDFEKEETVYQIGVAPVRIDIITSIVGVSFEEAYQNAEIVEIDDVKFPIIPIECLIKNKKAAGRPRDLNDAQHLEEILKRRAQKKVNVKKKTKK